MDGSNGLMVEAAVKTPTLITTTTTTTTTATATPNSTTTSSSSLSSLKNSDKTAPQHCQAATGCRLGGYDNNDADACYQDDDDESDRASVVVIVDGNNATDRSESQREAGRVQTASSSSVSKNCKTSAGEEQQANAEVERAVVRIDTGLDVAGPAQTGRAADGAEPRQVSINGTTFYHVDPAIMRTLPPPPLPPPLSLPPAPPPPAAAFVHQQANQYMGHYYYTGTYQPLALAANVGNSAPPNLLPYVHFQQQQQQQPQQHNHHQHHHHHHHHSTSQHHSHHPNNHQHHQPLLVVAPVYLIPDHHYYWPNRHPPLAPPQPPLLQSLVAPPPPPPPPPTYSLPVELLHPTYPAQGFPATVPGSRIVPDSDQRPVVLYPNPHQAGHTAMPLTDGFQNGAVSIQQAIMQPHHYVGPTQPHILAPNTGTTGGMPPETPSNASQAPPGHGTTMTDVSQLKLGYNLLPLLPINAIPTRVRQAYGMDKVWQDEFEQLFSQFVSQVVWTLVEVETNPSIRASSRILAYKGRYVVRVDGPPFCGSTDEADGTASIATVASVRGAESDELEVDQQASGDEENDVEYGEDSWEGVEGECCATSTLDEASGSDDNNNSSDYCHHEEHEAPSNGDSNCEHDCDSGAVLNSTSGCSETTSQDLSSPSELGPNQSVSPTSPPPASCHTHGSHDKTPLSSNQSSGASSSNGGASSDGASSSGIGRKFPLKFRMFIDSAKVRFCCDSCGHGWTSMKGRVVFWYELFELVDGPGRKNTADGVSNLIGYCAYKLFGQQCDICKIENRFERPMWYPEEVTKVLCNLFNKIGQVYFGLRMPTIDKQRRAGRPKTSHNSLLCQACHDGVCTDRK